MSDAPPPEVFGLVPIERQFSVMRQPEIPDRICFVTRSASARQRITLVNLGSRRLDAVWIDGQNALSSADRSRGELVASDYYTFHNTGDLRAGTTIEIALSGLRTRDAFVQLELFA